MTNALRIGLAAIVFAGCALPQAAPSTDAAILGELKSLRVALLEDLAERQAERIELLAAELEGVRIQRARFDQALAAQREDTQNWSREVWSAEYTPEQRAQLESEKAAVDAESAKSLNREKHAAAERESALSTRLNRERERYRRLAQELVALQRPR